MPNPCLICIGHSSCLKRACTYLTLDARPELVCPCFIECMGQMFGKDISQACYFQYLGLIIYENGAIDEDVMFKSKPGWLK